MSIQLLASSSNRLCFSELRRSNGSFLLSWSQNSGADVLPLRPKWLLIKSLTNSVPEFCAHVFRAFVSSIRAYAGRAPQLFRHFVLAQVRKASPCPVRKAFLAASIVEALVSHNFDCPARDHTAERNSNRVCSDRCFEDERSSRLHKYWRKRSQIVVRSH